MSHQVRVAFDEDTFERMEEGAPAALQDPEVVRHYVSLGLVLSDVMQSSIHESIAGGVQPAQADDLDDEQ
ncbi:hypothetical protein [Haloferax sulfurifontis]|uniref:Uncharacterized protein n=2 Tax=Haloferax sulfurifontis TaxID=255616 RepID=M0IL74_9EURY|nr:hypothetical protein [Haloferax sulfurifontis]ELZ96603.1 hypothetical protein C441_04524 [Haloferax sulfurifontis ATCC BAA-897]GGC72547.1 hypothetical protein GCM10007209_38120 [Haloferax sulfurifontis]